MFCDGWNNHPLSSEHGISPIQLWVHGLSQASLLEEFTDVSKIISKTACGIAMFIISHSNHEVDVG